MDAQSVKPSKAALLDGYLALALAVASCSAPFVGWPSWTATIWSWLFRWHGCFRLAELGAGIEFPALPHGSQ